MYVQVGDFCVSRGPTTVPLTWISCNTVFSKSQNARKAGTLCISGKSLRPGSNLNQTTYDALLHSFMLIRCLLYNHRYWRMASLKILWQIQEIHQLWTAQSPKRAKISGYVSKKSPPQDFIKTDFPFFIHLLDNTTNNNWAENYPPCIISVR